MSDLRVRLEARIVAGMPARKAVDVAVEEVVAWLRERAKHQRNLGALARVVSHQELTEDAARRYEALADEIERREASDERPVD